MFENKKFLNEGFGNSFYSEQKKSNNDKNRSFDLSIIKSYLSKVFSNSNEQQGQDLIRNNSHDSFFELEQNATNDFVDLF